MNKNFNERLEELFSAAIDLEEAERGPFLDRECGEDGHLRKELESLLEANRSAGGYFTGISRDIAAGALMELEKAAQPRIRIGPYRALEVVGRGGMGVVYLAKRVDGEFDQQVALKLLHLDMDSPSIRARFLAERQLLAQLSHPNIARLLDGGVTEEGRPYFVMEYVRGQPITAYCREKNLSAKEVLLLFRKVIQAVHYLHQNLVVHRDLKPSNILVDGEGQVKLLDFGIAKLMGNGLSSNLTATGERLLTPNYAAPEQLEGKSVTTATDVFALGAVLYELLTGCGPFENLRSGDRVHGEANLLAPSLALRSMHKEGTKPSTVPSGSWRKLRGDLDNLCLMALRTEPKLRYASAEQFSGDIECYLSGRPLRASRGAFGYRIAKFVRRNQKAVGLAVVVVVLLGIGFWRERRLRYEASRAQLQAQEETAKAEAISDFLTNLLSSADPSIAQGRDLTVEEVLKQAAVRLEVDNEFLKQPEVEGAVRLALGNTYSALGKYGEAREQLERALDLAGGRGSLDPEALDAQESLAMVYFNADLAVQAEPLLRQVLQGRVQTLGEDHPTTLTTISNLGNILWAQDRFEEVEALDRRTLEIRLRTLGENHLDTLRSRSNVGSTLFATGRLLEAEEVYAGILSSFQEKLGDDHPETIKARSNLSATYGELGRYRDAAPLQREILKARRRILGEEHRDTATITHNLGVTLGALAHYEEAETLLLRAIELRKKLEGPSGALFSRSSLADLYRAQGRYAEADELYRSTLEEQRKDRGEEDHRTLTTRHGLAELRLMQGRVEEAEALIVPVLEIQEETLGPRHVATLGSRITMAKVRQAQKRFAEANGMLISVIETGQESLTTNHPLVLEASEVRVEGLLDLGEPKEAAHLAKQIYRGWVKGFGDDHPSTKRALTLVVEALEAAGDGAEADRFERIRMNLPSR